MVIEPDPENALCFPFFFFLHLIFYLGNYMVVDTKNRRDKNAQAQKLTHTHLCYISGDTSTNPVKHSDSSLCGALA